MLKRQKDKQYWIEHYTENLSDANPTKAGGELRCSASGTRRVTLLVTMPTIRHECCWNINGMF